MGSKSRAACNIAHYVTHYNFWNMCNVSLVIRGMWGRHECVEYGLNVLNVYIFNILQDQTKDPTPAIR